MKAPQVVLLMTPHRKEPQPMTDLKGQRYSVLSLPLSKEEIDLVEVVAKIEKLKRATVARCLYYRGIAAFLEDEAVCTDEPEGEVYARLEQWINQDADTAAMLRLLRREKPKKRQVRRKRV